jgi:N utilization substance protein A
MKLGSESKQAIESLALDKGVTVDSMYEALVSAFRSAYMRIPGAAEEARVTLNPDTGEVLIYAQHLDADENVIEEWKVELDDDEFGRIAAQSFKQMMTTKIRDAKRATVLDAYIGREGELVTGIVTQFDARFNQTILDLQDAEAVIPAGERVPFERLERGNRVKAVITEIREDAKGIPIVVSRSRAEFVQRMLELEVPELTDGTVELRAIAREAGSRTKIAVFSNDPNVDPKGACVGSRGSRVRQIVNELRGEKLDVVEWREDKVRFIKEALGPAEINEVEIDEYLKTAKVVVKDSQLSLAIGKEGQNARLAAKLTGYKIDIQGLGDSPKEEIVADIEEDTSKEEE